MDAGPSQLEQMYREHAPSLLRYLSRRFPAAAAPEDLLQETFLQAARAAQRLKAEKREAPLTARAWLFGIARHVGLTAVRRSTLRITSELPAADLLPAHPQTEDRRLEQVRAAIACLPDAMRETLEFRLRNELSYEEIATVLDIPVGTVRSRLHQAVKQLREMVGEEL